MTRKPATSKDAADKVVKNSRRKTRQTYSSEEKIRIVVAGLRGKESIAVLCRREWSLSTNLPMGPYVLDPSVNRQLCGLVWMLTRLDSNGEFEDIEAVIAQMETEIDPDVLTTPVRPSKTLMIK